MYGYVKDTNILIDVFGLASFFRSMSRVEFYDILENGWRAGANSMDNKWFAESFEDAAEWGHTMGHGADNKFYVTTVEMPDSVTDNAFRMSKLDGIGSATNFNIEDLNNHGLSQVLIL
ncbi:hypothetical protein ACQKNB_16595 [Lysinibacillus xylanilyticus]|uniref:hypothetical protein n=1 Tax=Lysinibacillus xylanilyticus TaxID=582475 RepID=UPI003CFCB444